MSERMSFGVHEKNGKVVNALSRLRRVERREWESERENGKNDI